MKKQTYIICIALVVVVAVLICILPKIDTISCTMEAVSLTDGKLSDESYSIKLSGKVCKYLILEDKLKLSAELSEGKSIKVEAPLLKVREEIQYASGLYYDASSNAYEPITILFDRDYTQFLIQCGNGAQVIVAKSDPAVDFQEIYDQLCDKLP